MKLNALQEAQKHLERLKMRAGDTFSQLGTGVRGVQKRVQPVAQQIVKGVANRPLLGVGMPFQAAKPIGPTIGDYAKGQIMEPIRAGIRQTQGAPGINRALGVAQVAGGAFAATPPGAVFNIGAGLLGGGLQAIRNRQPIGPSISRAISEPTSIAREGLGINNPLLAGAIDIGLTRNPKSTFKDAGKIKQIVKSFVNKPVHVEDAQMAQAAIDYLRSARDIADFQAPRYQRSITDLKRVAEHYMGKSTTKLKVEELVDAVENRIKLDSGYEKFYHGRLPKSSLVESKDQTKGQAINQISQGLGKEKGLLGENQQLRKSLAGEGQKLTQTGQAANSSGTIISQSTNDYLKTLTKAQEKARTSGPSGFKQKISGTINQIKKAFVDSTAPIEDALGRAEKVGKYQVLPKQDVRLQIDRVLRSKTLASQFAEDNGLVDAIRKAPELNALDQYMIAKQASRVQELGKQTGRDLAKDQQLIRELGPQYEQLAQQVNGYSQKLLDYSTKTGLIDESLAAALKQKYPEYVPLQRIFNELERTEQRYGTKAIASLSKQSVVQKLEGSEREIASPIESLVAKTQTAFEQGERNMAGKMLAGYKDLPEFKTLIRELKGGESGAHTFSYLDKGVKRTFETTPEIAAAAKNLDQEQLNIVLKIASIPTRTLQLGATGLNVPFAATNLLKDQITSFINSSQSAKTSLLNPFNFMRSLLSAVKHDELYKEMVRNAGGGTSFDISRQAPNLSVQKIRAGRSAFSNIKYTVTRPGELLRALEDLVGRTEQATRIQQYRGTKAALKNRTAQDATLLAAKAARENTANFARKGDIGKVVNYLIPFFNAGIQGSRVFVRNMQQRPIQTGTKLAIGVFMPVAATTAWNMSDPERKKIYDDIDEFEKQNNLILIPNGATLDDKGKYNVIKIPLPPGLANLGTIVRRSMESVNGLDPVNFGEIANNLLTATSSIDVSNPNKAMSTFIPQGVKPFIETYTNTNLFTGKKIVPDSLADLPVEEQARPYTSGTAQLTGKALGQSPLKIENFIRTSLGGLGGQLMNASDKALNAAGAIPKEQVSGEDILGNLKRRFSEASGGKQETQRFEQLRGLQEEGALMTRDERKKAEQILKTLQTGTPKEKLEAYLSAKENDRILQRVRQGFKDEQAGVTSSDRFLRSLGVAQRAKYIYQTFEGKTPKEKLNLYLEYKKKGILTSAVKEELGKQFAQ